jgi:hypothetical protein
MRRALTVCRRPAGARCRSTALPEQWAKLAAEDLKGKPVDSLVWKSPEGIPIKPIYTKEDVADVRADAPRCGSLMAQVARAGGAGPINLRPSPRRSCAD